MKRAWITLLYACVVSLREVVCQNKLRRWQDGGSFDTSGSNIGGHASLGFGASSSNLNAFSDGGDVNSYGTNINGFDAGNGGNGFDAGGHRDGSELSDYVASGSVNGYGGGGDISGYGAHTGMNEFVGGDSGFHGNDINSFGGFHGNDMVPFDGNNMGNFGENGGPRGANVNIYGHNPWGTGQRSVKTIVKHTVKNIAIPHPVPAPIHVPVPRYVGYFKPFPVVKPVAVPDVIPVVKHIQKPIAFFTSIPIPRSVPVPKFIGLPVHVRVPRPVLIRVPKIIPVAKKFAVPITVNVPKPYVVPIYQQVPVPVPHKIPKIINIIKEVPHVVKKPIPIYVDEHGRTEFAPSSTISNYVRNEGFGGQSQNDFNHFNNFDSEEEYNDGYEQDYDVHPPQSPGYSNSFGETFNQYQKYQQQSTAFTKPRAHRLPNNPQQYPSTSNKPSAVESPRQSLHTSVKDTNKSPGATSDYELSLEITKNKNLPSTSLSSSSSSSSTSTSMSSDSQQKPQYHTSNQPSSSGTSTSSSSSFQSYSPQNSLSTFAKDLQNMASMYTKSYPLGNNMVSNQYSFEYHNPSTGSTTSQFFSSGSDVDASNFANFAEQFSQSLAADSMKNAFESTYGTGNVFPNMRNPNNNKQSQFYTKNPSKFTQFNKQLRSGNKNSYIADKFGNLGTAQSTNSYNQNGVQQQQKVSNFGYDSNFNSFNTALMNSKPHSSKMFPAQGYSPFHMTSHLDITDPSSTRYQNIGGDFSNLHLQGFKTSNKATKLSSNQNHKLTNTFANPESHSYTSPNLDYYETIYNNNKHNINPGYKNIKPQYSNVMNTGFGNGNSFNNYQNTMEASTKQPYFANNDIVYGSAQSNNVVNNQNDAYKALGVDNMQAYSGSHSTSAISSITENGTPPKNTFTSKNHEHPGQSHDYEHSQQLHKNEHPHNNEHSQQLHNSEHPQQLHNSEHPQQLHNSEHPQQLHNSEHPQQLHNSEHPQQLHNHKPASTLKQPMNQQTYLENHKSPEKTTSRNPDTQDNEAHPSTHSHTFANSQKMAQHLGQSSPIDASAAASYQGIIYSDPADGGYQSASRFDELVSSGNLQNQFTNKPQTTSNNIVKFYSDPDPLADYIASVSHSEEVHSRDQAPISTKLLNHKGSLHQQLRQDPSENIIQMNPWNTTRTSMSISTQVQSPSKLPPTYWSPPLGVSPNPVFASSTSYSSQDMKVISGPDSAEKTKMAVSSGQASPVFQLATSAPEYKTSISVAYQVAEDLPSRADS